MANISAITPEEIEICTTFLRNLFYLVDRYSEQDEASRHGESDAEFAVIVDQLTQLVAGEEPEVVATFFQATFAAVIATVRHYQQKLLDAS